MNTNTHLVGIEGGRGYFSKSRGGGCKKNLGKKIGTLKAGGGKKIDPLARIYTPVYQFKKSMFNLSFRLIKLKLWTYVTFSFMF